MKKVVGESKRLVADEGGKGARKKTYGNLKMASRGDLGLMI